MTTRNYAVVGTVVVLALIFALIGRSPKDSLPIAPAAVGVIETRAPSPLPMSAPPATNASTPRSPAFPYSFLGMLTEDGVPTIVLYANGRTVKVRGPGRIDELWEVEEIRDSTLAIRHVPSGTRRVVKLAAPHPLAIGGSPDDSPQD
jgi:hypothetical protein